MGRLLLSHVFLYALALAADGARVRSTVSYAYQVGAGNVSSNYDFPFNAINVSGTVRGYSGNQVTRLMTEGSTVSAVLPTPQPTNLSRGGPEDLDACGAWLSGAVYNESTGIVHGFYHEEWHCNYSVPTTNKSIAYAESRDGGRTFVKVGHPHNAIILPPPGNTTSKHDMGEGDHCVVHRNGFYYLYFLEWDGFDSRLTVGVARAAEASGGRPGTWYKWYKGAFSEPGIGGQSSLLPGMTSTAIAHRKQTDDLLHLAGSHGNDGLTLLRSTDGLNFSAYLQEPLWPYTVGSWVRNANATELVAYPSMVGPGGTRDVSGPFFVTYTYVQPGEGFANRYMAWRNVTLEEVDDSDTAPLGRVQLAVYENKQQRSWWATTQMVPNALGYVLRSTPGYLMTAPASDNSTVQLRECYMAQTQDHMVGLGDVECPVGSHEYQRTLGWVFKEEPPYPSVPLFRCFNKATRRHSVSTTTTCESGSLEFRLGFLLAA